MPVRYTSAPALESKATISTIFSFVKTHMTAVRVYRTFCLALQHRSTQENFFVPFLANWAWYCNLLLASGANIFFFFSAMSAIQLIHLLWICVPVGHRSESEGWMEAWLGTVFVLVQWSENKTCIFRPNQVIKKDLVDTSVFMISNASKNIKENTLKAFMHVSQVIHTYTKWELLQT